MPHQVLHHLAPCLPSHIFSYHSLLYILGSSHIMMQEVPMWAMLLLDPWPLLTLSASNTQLISSWPLLFFFAEEDSPWANISHQSSSFCLKMISPESTSVPNHPLFCMWVTASTWPLMSDVCPYQIGACRTLTPRPWGQLPRLFVFLMNTLSIILSKEKVFPLISPKTVLIILERATLVTQENIVN